MGQSWGGSAWRIGRADDKYAGLAQLGRASALQAEGHWFEPSIPHHKDNMGNVVSVSPQKETR